MAAQVNGVSQTNGHPNGANGTAGSDKIILYTNHRCPWAQRAHTTLNELGLPYEEVIIDLDRPRDPSYLAVNPRGLVPSLSVNGQILTESAVVAQFLADAYPSHLLPSSVGFDNALLRARIAFFVATYFEKFNDKGIGKQLSFKTDEEQEAAAATAIASLVKEVEPLLKDANPFFGGSGQFTLAEVLTGGHVARLLALSKAGVYPKSIPKELADKAPSFYKWATAVAEHPSITKHFPAAEIVQSQAAKKEKNRSVA